MSRLPPDGGGAVLVGLLEGMAQRLRRPDERLVEAICWGSLMR